MPARGSRLPAVGVTGLAVVLVVLVALLARSLSAPEEVAQGPSAAVPGEVAPAENVSVPLEDERAGDGAAEAAAEDADGPDRDEALRKVTEAPEAPEPTRLTGRVVDGDGEPVAGALVLLGSSRGPWPLDAPGPEGSAEPARASSSAEGRFLIEPVPEGNFVLAVRRNGFAPLDVDPLALAGESLDLGELELGLSPVLRGRVVDAEGRPVPEARLVSLPELLPGAPEVLNARNGAHVATTDAFGQFEVRRLRRGDWRLLVSSALHPEQVFEGRADGQRGPVEGLVFQLAPGAVLRGRIVDADIASEEPLLVHAVPSRLLEGAPGAPETLAGFRRVRVDSWGTFELTGLILGEVHGLRVLKPGQPTRAQDAFSSWTYARAGAGEVELTYGPSAVLSFTVQNRYDGSALDHFRFDLSGAWPSTLLDEDGGRVTFHSGGRVELRVRPERLVPNPAFTDVLESAGCVLLVEAEGHEAFVLENLRLVSGQRTDLGALRLTPLPTLDLRVVDGVSGEPVEGASVSCQGAVAETDADGLATVFFPMLDVATVEAWKEDTSAEAEVPMGATNSSAPFELRLQPHPAPGALAVAVTDMAGNPLRQHWVVRTTPPGSEVDLQWLPVDTGGRVSFRVEPGTHGVRTIARPRLGSVREPPIYWQSVTVRPGEEVEVSIFGQRLEAVMGRLMLGGLPVADARLRLDAGPRIRTDVGAEWAESGTGRRLRELGYSDWSGPAQVGLEARTGPEGRFAFEDVAPGWYSLLVDHSASGVRTLVMLEADSFEHLIDLDAFSVVGMVHDSAGVAVAGAQVSAYSEEGYISVDPEVRREAPAGDLVRAAVPFAVTTTDRFGRYAFDAFPTWNRCSIVARSGNLSGQRWGVRAPEREGTLDVDVLVRPTATLAVRVDRPDERSEGGGRAGVLLSNTYRPAGHAEAFSFLDGEGRAHFGGLADGEWQVVLLVFDAQDRVADGGEWSDVTLEVGEHHELALEWPFQR